jgi:pimeloyl-ACP methyl ester carboxylesterase
MSDPSAAVPLGLSSPDFIQFSCSCPVQFFEDVMDNLTWEYRFGGRSRTGEAVVFVPSIYETTNGWYKVASGVLSAGHTVMVVNIPATASVLAVQIGFDQLLASKLVSRVHLVGVGFGGFLALHLVNFRSLAAEVLSLTVIAGFMNTSVFTLSDGLLARLTGRADLIGELAREQSPAGLRPAIDFAAAELAQVPGAAVALRIRLRRLAPPAPIPAIAADRVLIIQPTDWAVKCEEASRPHKTIPGCRYEKIPAGGFLPHLANPDAVLALIGDHLARWRSPAAQWDPGTEK